MVDYDRRRNSNREALSKLKKELSQGTYTGIVIQIFWHWSLEKNNSMELEENETLTEFWWLRFFFFFFSIGSTIFDREKDLGQLGRHVYQVAQGERPDDDQER